MRPFAYLFNTFWSTLQDVVVLTDQMPSFSLPANFSYITPSNGALVPKAKWSNFLMKALGEVFLDELFVLMLEDYWLVRTVDVTGVETLGQYMAQHQDVAKMDLTSDRQFNGNAKPIGFYGHYDLVETPPPSDYQLSLQAGIWRRSHLLDVLRPGWDAWQTELEGTTVLNSMSNLRVMGTCQRPVRYANALKGGNAKDLREEEMQYVPEEHMTFMRENGLI